jgi:hypothetical protein
MAIWSIFPPFGIYCVSLWLFLWLFGTFSPIWYIVPGKIWQPCWSPLESSKEKPDMKEKKFLKQIYFSAAISLQGIMPCFSYEKVRYCQIFLGPNIPNKKKIK